MSNDYPPHALRIPAGWLVELNEFYEMPLDHPLAWSVVCKANLLQLRHPHRNTLVVLGWSPDEDAEGGYVLRANEGDLCGRELFRFEGRDREVVIAALELLLNVTANFGLQTLGDESA